jgi:hypothetical protein
MQGDELPRWPNGLRRYAVPLGHVQCLRLRETLKARTPAYRKRQRRRQQVMQLVADCRAAGRPVPVQLQRCLQGPRGVR